MKSVLPILAFATLAACSSAGGTAGSPEPRATRQGIYDFSASIQGSLVRGKLNVLSDTILVDAENGDCAAVTGNSRFFRVGCRSLDWALLMFDRGNPGQGAKWEGNVPVQRRREVCARYEVRNGREVCAAMKSETYTALEPRSGPVQMRRVP